MEKRWKVTGEPRRDIAIHAMARWVTKARWGL